MVWISDGVAGAEGQAFSEGLARMKGEGPLTVLKTERAPALALAGIESAAGQLAVRVVRAEPNGRDAGTLRALDPKNLPLADASFAFPPAQPRPRRASTCRSISATPSSASRFWERARPEP